jgi:ubiquinone/menaquinone biosynthesis C-methylase UbiE
MKDPAKVAKFWGEKARNKTEAVECHWTDSELIMKYYIHPTISGTMNDNWFTWVKNTYFSRPVEKALSLGCGDGCLERHGAFVDVFKHCDAFDISPGALDIARTKAINLGIAERVCYESRDINNISLNENCYDVVFCSMSLHHFENLEHIFDEIDKSLKPCGYFIINEYVGPDRFQWTDLQLEISNDLLKLLPEEYRYDPSTRSIKNEIARNSLDHMISTDPSEAVRSSDILPLLEKRFEIVKKVDYGGTLVNLLLDNIIVNFDENKSEDLTILNQIFYIEKLLIQKKVIDSDFVMVIANKRGSRSELEERLQLNCLTKAMTKLRRMF